MLALIGLDPADYAASALHDPSRIFRESNCYVDLWIELLHALGIDPASALAFACTVDFEGDQWTFFKPPPEDLFELYGIDVHEMQFYRPAVEHIVEQLSAGRTVTIEADSFYLPDTVTTAYKRAHVKSSIAIEGIDPAGQRLRYFHGAGYYELSGEDYRGLFRLGRPFSEDVLPPYVELVRLDAGARLQGEELRCAAQEVLERHLARKPERNPWLAFGDRLAKDLPQLLAGTEESYHAYAFATVRQCGAAFECARSFVEWLAACGKTNVDPRCLEACAAAEAFGRQVNGAKTLLLKLARRRVFDPSPLIEDCAAAWESAMGALEHLSIAAVRGAA